MDDQYAQRLQRLAIEALSNLRSWLWEQHGALLPNDVSAISRQEARGYAACLQWYSAIEDVLHTLQSAGPVPTAALLAGEPLLPPPAPRALSCDEPPPTLRVTAAERPTSGSGIWHRTIALEPLGARHADQNAA
jgi:hypothetical protein